MNLLYITKDETFNRTVIEASEVLKLTVDVCDTIENARKKIQLGIYSLVLIFFDSDDDKLIQFCRENKNQKTDKKIIYISFAAEKINNLLKNQLIEFVDLFLSTPLDSALLQIKLSMAVTVIQEAEEENKLKKILNHGADFFRTFVELSRDFVLILNGSLRIIYNTPFITELTGLDNNTMQSRSILDIMHIQDSIKFKEAFEFGCNNPLSGPIIEFRIRNSSGFWSTIEAKIRILFDDNGISNIVINGRDVTAKKEVEKQFIDTVSNNNKMMHLILENMQEGVIIINKKKQFIVFNKAAEKIWGEALFIATVEEWEQTYLLYDSINSVEINIEDRPLLKTLQGKKTDEKEYYFIKKNTDEKVYILLNANPVFHENNDVTGGVCVFKNISEIKESEKRKKIIEFQLQQAQKLESIGQLASGIAHEINTPIQYIGDNTRFIENSIQNIYVLFESYSTLVSDLLNGGVKKSVVSRIKKMEQEVDIQFLKTEMPAAISETLSGIDHVSKIVRSMKEFSHPDSKKKDFANINNIIQNAVNVSRNEWKYSLNMEMKLDESIPEILCFPGDLSQVILNLIINSSHSIQEKKLNTSFDGKLRIETRFKENNVEIIVSDNGMGIPQNIRHKIFDPFFTTKPVGKGTGQGLYMAISTIREKHNGTISFSSIEREGTDFFIAIPFQSMEGDENEQ